MDTPTGIFREEQKFYEALYTTNKQQLQEDYLHGKNNRGKLEMVDRGTLDRELDMEELDLAVKQLKSSKAPGTDYLPVYFNQEKPLDIHYMVSEVKELKMTTC